MLRGAIDYSDGSRIGGWIYSPEIVVRDRAVLAFVDDQCVGSGKIDRHRQDLADAGLGDGHSGFDFPVTLPRLDDRGRVRIKLDLSDFALLQSDSRVVAPGNSPAVRQDHSASSIDWMLTQRWIDAPAAECLRGLLTIGAHSVTLDGDAAVVAKRVLELHVQGPVRLQESLMKLRNLGQERLHLIEGAATPIIAISAAGGSISLGNVHAFDCHDDCLLLVDARAPLSSGSDETARIYRGV